jgi:hypothetical protein
MDNEKNFIPSEGLIFYINAALIKESALKLRGRDWLVLPASNSGLHESGAE